MSAPEVTPVTVIMTTNKLIYEKVNRGLSDQPPILAKPIVL